ncbi:MAG: DNA polymerase III subunit delta' [Gammaproteobacteria bacterium]
MNNLANPMAPWLLRQLQQLRQHRGHALLLAGPSGLGQYELALGLARAWLCEMPGDDGACGQCPSCHAIDVRTHADLCVLMPETVALDLGWPLDESAQKEIDDKKRKPSKLIRVEAARQAIAFAQMSHARGRGKVVLVYPADRMNIEAANTLLKTLEEPVGEVRFVLATEAAHQLLPTIRSRCQSHLMQWPDTEEAVSWLQQQWARQTGPVSVDPDQAHTLLRASGGRPADALMLAAQGIRADVWDRLPAAIAQGDWRAMSDWPPARQLDVLHKLCHDLLAMTSGGQPRYFEAASLPGHAHPQRLAAWARELMQATRTVEHPFQPGLLQEAWAARARQVLSRYTKNS